MDEIFEIVADYPDSQPSVIELYRILDETKLQSQLAAALRTSLVQRLLHPGANTSQIIDVYINTIKVLREIDPSDRLLEIVAEPVRSYLRGRKDTVRCIITRCVNPSYRQDSGYLHLFVSIGTHTLVSMCVCVCISSSIFTHDLRRVPDIVRSQI